MQACKAAMLLCLLSPVFCTIAGGVDPEAKMTTPELIAHWGYPAEVHAVTTVDGYILELHRIPRGKAAKADGTRRPTVFMQHGLLSSSADWALNMPWQSAGFMFADAGFDVWLGNFRGNTYSGGHVNLTQSSHQYWQFTWDEMAKYDLPAMIDYALAQSGNDQLHYIGHSMGTTTAFAAFSTNKTLASKIAGFYALAPVTTVGYVGGMLRVLEPFIGDVDKLLQWFGEDEFLPSNFVLHWLAKSVCGLWVTDPVCENVLFLICGTDTHQLNATRVPVYLAHTPAGTSTINMMHFIQQMKSKEFQAYDWGSTTANVKHYGQPTPPLYDASKCTVDTYLFSGTPDVLADPTDVQLLAKQLHNLKGHYVYPTFNHLDFVWGMDAGGQLYEKIIKIIKSRA